MKKSPALRETFFINTHVSRANDHRATIKKWGRQGGKKPKKKSHGFFDIIHDHAHTCQSSTQAPSNTQNSQASQLILQIAFTQYQPISGVPFIGYWVADIGIQY
jgi:hypothetical protein